jgi:FlaA1/EpsC-like NDP-sugar epimerase
MIKRLVTSYSSNFLSSWTVLFIDVLTVGGAFLLAYFIRFNFNYLVIDPYDVQIQILSTTSIYSLSFLLTRSYSGIVRHTGLSDVFRILKAVGIALGVLILVNIILSLSGKHSVFFVPYSILISHFLLSLFLLVGTRVIVKLLFLQITRQFAKEKIPVLIYGAGAAGMLTKNALIKDKVYRYDVIAYVDDNPSKVSKRLEGIPVINQYRALRTSYIERHGIKQLIIAIQGIHPEKKKKVVEAGLDMHLEVKVVPAINNWINGQLSATQLRRVKIEELLERDTIQLDNKNIDRELNNKVVMVTGGAGSIGCEIARQVLNYAPKRLIVLDQAESPIYDLQFEINNTKEFEKYHNRIEFIVASVKDKFRMNNIFSIYKPDIIYHAAAYKHVPLMEDNPYEALMVNIFGTKIIADLSAKHGAEKFVMVSTDKAVNPTNIMGASKRIAEIYIQSLQTCPPQEGRSTKYVTTRFGNVLGSNGSVVPLFRKQIEAGGPITVTHKEITRYFMTIPEACNLVLEAGAMGVGADIFVFDMGQPVRIYDMAKKMVKLYGFTEDEIEIKETGLRPGEKLYEELLTSKENTLPTHHPKIMRAEVNTLTHEQICNHFDELSEIIVEADEFSLVAKMKQIVPEFVSNNSVYEKLDVRK